MNQFYIEPQMQHITQRVNNSVKLIKVVQAFNEEEFILANLRNGYDEFDRIIVIEGGIKTQPHEVMTEDGHSKDNTLALIRQFKETEDKNNKVELITIRRPWNSLEEMKQLFIDLVSIGDILIIADVDEFYQLSDLKRIRRIFDLYPNTSEIIPAFIHYYRDLHHCFEPGAEWSPQPQRVIKIQQGMKYNAHPTITDQYNQDTYFSPAYWHRRFTLNNFFIHHLGYARTNMKDSLLTKQKYYSQELKKHDGANKPFDEKIKEFLDFSEPLDKILTVPVEIQPQEVKNLERFEYLEPFYQDKNLRSMWDFEYYRKIKAGESVELIYNCMTRPALSVPILDPIYNHLVVDR